MEQLKAIDCLNSWVRSKGHWDWICSSPRYAIYDWKREAIKLAIMSGEAEYRAIYLTLNCRDCGGSKRFIDSTGYEWPHCRKCSSTGHTRLTFLETDIKGIRWHSPWEKTYGIPTREKTFENATICMDWEPNQIGKDLETWEVAKYLNILERDMPIRHGSHGIYDCGDYYGEREHSQYRIFLGRSERVCEFCGRPAVPKEGAQDLYDGVHHHVSRGHVAWCAWACNVCKALFSTSNVWSDTAGRYVPSGGNGKSIFDEFRIPQEMMSHEEIRQWLARRGELDRGLAS